MRNRLTPAAEFTTLAGISRLPVQNLIPEHPYQFVPPRFSRFWTWLVSFRLPAMLRNRFGVTEVEFLGLERLADSLAEGHGIVVAPNHSHPADPFIAAGLGLRVGRPVHLMATRHIFEESALQRFLLTRVGNFSVSREGTDFRAIRCAENIIVEARHPLVMFPEGIVTRSNDRLIPFQRGVSLIARRAAARRAREGGRVVVHPMFIRYTHQGNVEAATAPVLADLGKRIGGSFENALPLRERILNLGEALLADKEREYCGEPGTGPLIPRIKRLIEVVLDQVEPRWVRHVRARDAMARVRIIRSAIVGHLYRTDPGSPERQAMWRDIEHLYLVQLLYCYPPGYLEESCVTNDRLLEIVEHFEEDLTDVSRPHPPMRAIGWVGEALPVEPYPRRPPRPDPWTSELKIRMESLRVASLKNPRH